ncbi:MAG: hypothetical protein KF873_23010 [Gemmataceae bacterium]|nr:hypothetical protein [Gemmataceae bacterium]
MRYALLGLFLVPSLAVAQPRDVAALFPTSTVAYAELRDPASIADGLAAIVKGSPFEDGLNLLHNRKDAAKELRLVGGSTALAGAALLASPEFLGEFRKIRGAAIGFFGLTAGGEPKIAACVLTGDSLAAALYARSHLANEPTLRRVAVVDGVPIFQSRALPAQAFDPNTGKPVPFEPKPATEGPCEPTYAYTARLFIVASNKEAIADVIAHNRGTVKESLATSNDFAAQRTAGIHAFVRTVELVAFADAARKANKEILPAELVAALKLVLNPRSIPKATAHATLGPAGLRWTIDLHRDPKQPSPMLDLVGSAVPAEALRTNPTGAAGGFSIGLPAKDRRVAAILAFVDALLKTDGNVGRTATEWVEEWEARSKLPLRAKLLPEVRGLSLILIPKPDLPPRVEPLPLVAIQLEAGASDWESAIPKFLAAVDGRDPSAKPSSETIGNVKVLTASLAGMPQHFARRENSWIFGLDRKQVAACCSGGGPIPALADHAVGAIRWPGLVQYETSRKLAGRLEHRSRGSNPFDVPFGGGLLPLGLLDPQNGGEMTAEEFQSLYGAFPPLTLRANHTANRFSVELRWDFDRDGANGFLTKLVPILERIGTAPSNEGLRFSPFDR